MEITQSTPETAIQSPGETLVWDSNFHPPVHCVFSAIQCITEMVERGEDLNAQREFIANTLDKALSWEGEVRDLDDYIHRYSIANRRKNARYLG